MPAAIACLTLVHATGCVPYSIAIPTSDVMRYGFGKFPCCINVNVHWFCWQFRRRQNLPKCFKISHVLKVFVGTTSWTRSLSLRILKSCRNISVFTSIDHVFFRRCRHLPLPWMNKKVFVGTNFLAFIQNIWFLKVPNPHGLNFCYLLTTTTVH